MSELLRRLVTTLGRSRWGAIVGSNFIYIVAFLALYRVLGTTAGILSVFPIAIVGWLHGTRPATFTAAITLCTTGILYVISVSLGTVIAQPLFTFPLLVVVFVLMAFITGRVHSIHQQLYMQTIASAKQQVLLDEQIAESAMAIDLLELSETRLRAVIANLPVILIAVDSSGNITMLEGKALEGIREASEPDQSALTLYRSQGRLVDSIRRALQGEEVEQTVEISDGVFEARYTPVRDPAGQITGAIGVAVEVTDRIRAENRLHRQFEATRVLAEAATLSEAMPRLFEIVARSFGWTWGALWTIDETGTVLRCSATWKSDENDLSTYPSITREMRFRRGQGLPGYVWQSAEPVFMSDVSVDPRFLRGIAAEQVGLHGGMWLPIILGQDVIGVLEFMCPERHIVDPNVLRVMSAIASQLGQFMERSRAETARALQFELAERARTEVRAVVEAASAAMLLLSLDGHVLLANRFVGEYFGIDPDQMVGHDRDYLLAHIDRVIASKGGFTRFLDQGDADPSTEFTADLDVHSPRSRQLSLFSTPARAADGTVLGRLLVFRDVTREREVDRLKTEFVSLVSHELRTPLTSIKGYADLLIDGEVGDISEEQGSFLTIIKNNADRLVALINDLLDISRIEAGKVELTTSPVSIAAVIDQVSQSFRPELVESHQSLTIEAGHDLPLVWGDLNRIIQIITNLLSNAHKYSPAGGQITIRAVDEGTMMRVSVSDTGIGMSASDLEQLFTRFFRASNTDTREVGGTGLGLSITKSLIEMHGGTISVESEVNRGSTFAFTLPISIEREEPVRKGVDRTAGARVLIIDDEPDIAYLLRRYLERGGFAVAIAATGQDGFQQALQWKPELIVLDVMLPDAEGFTVLEWLKANPATTAIPVIFLSITPDNGTGRRLGAVDYLLKPIQEVVLLDRARSIIADTRNTRVSEVGEVQYHSPGHP